MIKDGILLFVLTTLTNQCNNGTLFSTNLGQIQASFRKNEGFVYQNLLDKRQTFKANFKIHQLDRTADLKRTFLKGDSTNWSNNLHKITVIIRDTLPKYRIDTLPERYNEALLKKTRQTLKEKDGVMKKLN